MAVAIEKLRPLTIEDLDAFPDDGMRREIVTGELIVTAAPSPVHQQLVALIIRLIGNHVDDRQLGLVFPAPVDVRLSPNDVVEPDIVFVSEARLEIVTAKFIDGAPELVVEVLSPSTQQMDLVRKRALYSRSGINEYWIVDPDRRLLHLHRLESGLFVPVTTEDGVLRSTVLPDLEIDVPQIFSKIRR
jgi:Uma2 family endonuclease